MADLVITLEDEPVDATHVLEMASATVRALRAIERKMTKKPPAIKWRVDIMTGREQAIIKLSYADKGTVSERAFTDTAREAIRRMTQVVPASLREEG